MRFGYATTTPHTCHLPGAWLDVDLPYYTLHRSTLVDSVALTPTHEKTSHHHITTTTTTTAWEELWFHFTSIYTHLVLLPAGPTTPAVPPTTTTTTPVDSPATTGLPFPYTGLPVRLYHTPVPLPTVFPPVMPDCPGLPHSTTYSHSIPYSLHLSSHLPQDCYSPHTPGRTSCVGGSAHHYLHHCCVPLPDLWDHRYHHTPTLPLPPPPPLPPLPTTTTIEFFLHFYTHTPGVPTYRDGPTFPLHLGHSAVPQNITCYYHFPVPFYTHHKPTRYAPFVSLHHLYLLPMHTYHTPPHYSSTTVSHQLTIPTTCTHSHPLVCPPPSPPATQKHAHTNRHNTPPQTHTCIHHTHHIHKHLTIIKIIIHTSLTPY